MADRTVVATANVLYELGPQDARLALSGVLDLAPDLVGLQEWNPPRFRLLKETGTVQLLPGLGIRRRHRSTAATRDYHWLTPLVGGCAVGARGDRFELVDGHARVLSRPGRAERPDHWFNAEPPRIATVATYRDLVAERTICLVNYHLAPGVQAHGRYRDDRPVLTARHRQEVRNVQQLIDDRLGRGQVVYALGDSNFDGLRFSGVTSSWDGREDEVGTLGARRHVDDVHGPGRAHSIALLTNASDHKALIVDRADI